MTMHAALVLAVAAGGSLGALARLLVATMSKSWIEGFPVGTFLINVTGCFAFGLLWALHDGQWSRPVVAAVFTGFLGAFTTFSTFAFESLDLLQQGRTLAFVGNVLGQNILSVLSLSGGAWIGRCL
jgi:CrcB protein